MTALKFKKTNTTMPTLETITPVEAQAILDGNVNNRNLNKRLVAHYSSQLEDGKWQVNGETIKIDENGRLLDGQHRLTAIVKSNKPMTTYVVRGLKDESFKTIDCGKTRSPADFLKIAGQESNGVNLNVLAAAVKIAMCFDKETGEFKQQNLICTPTELVAFCDAHEGLAESVRVGQTFKGVVSSSIMAACHYVFSIVDPENADDFFAGLLSGEGLSKGNPILTLRNKLFSFQGTGKKSSGSVFRRRLISYLVQSFNSYRSGDQRLNLVYNSSTRIVLKDFAGSMK